MITAAINSNEINVFYSIYYFFYFAHVVGISDGKE